MTAEQVSGLVRHLLTFLGGWLIAKGWGDASAWDAIGGGIAALIGIIWSHVVKLPSPPTTT